MIDIRIIEKLASDLEKYAEAHTAYNTHMMKEATKLARVKLANDTGEPAQPKAEEVCDHGVPDSEFCSECAPDKNKKKKKKVASQLLADLASLAGFSNRGAV